MSKLKKPRWVQRLYALLHGYFWLPCPRCGQMSGGHETGDVGIPSAEPGTYYMVCLDCEDAVRELWENGTYRSVP